MSEVEKNKSSEEIENREVVDIELTKEQLDVIMDELDNKPNIDDVEDELFNNRIIFLDSAIDTEVVGEVVRLIKYFNLLDDKEGLDKSSRSPIRLHISSEGGEAYAGFNLLNTILNSTTPVWTYNEGTISYSMSYLLFLAGEKRFMGRFSFLLFHQLRGASDTKTLIETEIMLNHHKEMQEMMDEFIVERTSVPMNKLKSYRNKNADWYISYHEAKKYNMFTDTL